MVNKIIANNLVKNILADSATSYDNLKFLH